VLWKDSLDFVGIVKGKTETSSQPSLQELVDRILNDHEERTKDKFLAGPDGPADNQNNYYDGIGV
jgi:hypothetical protein